MTLRRRTKKGRHTAKYDGQYTRSKQNDYLFIQAARKQDKRGVPTHPRSVLDLLNIKLGFDCIRVFDFRKEGFNFQRERLRIVVCDQFKCWAI